MKKQINDGDLKDLAGGGGIVDFDQVRKGPDNDTDNTSTTTAGGSQGNLAQNEDSEWDADGR